MSNEKAPDPPIAYPVWICGRCDAHTVDLAAGDHQCESCGATYDHRGVFQPDPDGDPEYFDEAGNRRI